ncbi:hypothetical protein LY76DRAFT_423383 [Colletotrichum caudatum]|nr:hypothetical protein LY76DRAFT_423383 [Colletotrichum caudatum]
MMSNEETWGRASLSNTIGTWGLDQGAGESDRGRCVVELRTPWPFGYESRSSQRGRLTYRDDEASTRRRSGGREEKGTTPKLKIRDPCEMMKQREAKRSKERARAKRGGAATRGPKRGRPKNSVVVLPIASEAATSQRILGFRTCVAAKVGTF